MNQPTVRAVYRIPLPHDSYGEIKTGHALAGCSASFPPGCAVVLEVGAGYWCRGSELARVAGALDGVAHVSVTGTDLRRGGVDDAFDGVITGLAEIAARLAQLLHQPALFLPDVA